MEQLTVAERQQVEIELLQAMYPKQVHVMSCDLKYTATTGGDLVLRIPASYPEKGLPELISATAPTKEDLREQMKAVLNDIKLLQGEELLDAIISGFEHVVKADGITNDTQAEPLTTERAAFEGRCKTVIIWLHHLLNTNKRKLALNPSLSADPDGGTISGTTKPGYPGILVYSGPEDLVEAHVKDLKQQRWQAFQVRYEQVHGIEGIWSFNHGQSIVEVESISDTVQSIIGDAQRETFLKATGVK